MKHTNILRFACIIGFLFVSIYAISQIKVTGKVMETGDIPLPGVNVLLKGTKHGTITDLDGNYSITVPSKSSILQASFVGLTTQEKEVKSNTVINFLMESDAMNLDEVIVTGYATQTKREVISAISSISSKDITTFNASSLEQAIQGLAPGVRIGLSNGAPGADMDFSIRGIGTINAGSSPLCIIDGAVVQDGMRTVNPSDVANIQILKDAASTAIYGSRGSNGVILITTKQGQNSKPTFNLDIKFGLSGVERSMEVMNSRELMDYLDEAGNAYWSLPGFDPNNNTDWQKQIYQNAFTQTYNLSVSGGSKHIKYMVSASYFDQPGHILETSYQKFTLRSNLKIDFNKRINMTLNLSPTITRQKYVLDSGQQGSNPIMVHTLMMPPMFPVYYNGDYWTQNNFITSDLQADPRDPSRLPPSALPMANTENPVKMLNQQDRRRNSNRFNGTIAFEAKLLPDLVFKPSLNFDIYNQTQRAWSPSSIGARAGRTTDGKATLDITQRFTWINEYVFTYDKSFGENHKLLAVAGASFQNTSTDKSTSMAQQFGSDALETINGGSSFNATDLPYVDDRLASFFGRANYTLCHRYMLGAVFRADGSSKFGPNNKFGYFPSFSGGWVVSEEPFMKKIGQSVLNELKLRASWGITGNNAIGDFQYITTMESKNYIFGGSVSNGYAPSNLEAPDLRWEKSKSTNLGMDIGLFKNRIFLMVDLYRTLTSDMLLNTNIPSTLGQSSMLMNVGEMENKGLELNLTTRNLTGRFNWTTNFNVSFNKNKVLKLSTTGDKIFDGENDSNVTMVGKPVGVFYGRVYQGVYKNWEEIKALAADPNSGLAFDPKTIPGDMKFVDLDGNGVVDDDDRTIIGSPHPKFIFGMTNSFSFKNFKLNVLLTGQYGNKIYNYTIHPMGRGTNSNVIKALVNRYVSEEQPGDGWHPAIKSGASTDRNKFSTYQLEDGSYLRFRNVSLSYDVPKKLIMKSALQSLTFSVNADNLYTFTNYTGQNVEANSNSRATALGLDFTSYPSPRTFTFGISATF